MKAGLDVTAYEIAGSRAEFARRKLGVNVVRSCEETDGKFDVFFSSHVLEHLADLDKVLNLAVTSLKPGGMFVAFTPNGSLRRRDVDAKSWKSSWGFAHPNMLDERFYERVFQSTPLLIASDPYPIDHIARWGASRNERVVLDLQGVELLCVAMKLPQPRA